MKRLLYLLCLTTSIFLGFYVAKKDQKRLPFASRVYPASEFPLKERKTFVLIVYAYNQDAWVEKGLRAILTQNYDAYRVIFVDDASQDATLAAANQFVRENCQESRVSFIHHSEKIGHIASLHEVIHTLQDQEIVIPLLAQDFLAHPHVLQEINGAFQDPDTWIGSSASITYPSYEPLKEGFHCFYAAIFKQLSLSTLAEAGAGKDVYLAPLEKIGKNKKKQISEYLLIANQAAL